MSSTVYTFDVQGTHCGSCGIRIDEAVEDLPGIRRSQTSVRKGRTIVETEPGGADLDAIVLAITELGYLAKVRDA